MLMSLSRPIQWYHSHADPVWPDGTLNILCTKEVNKDACMVRISVSPWRFFLDHQGPTPSNGPQNGFARIKIITSQAI